MLGIDERALRIVWTVFLFGLTLALVYWIRGTILIFAGAIVLAYILSPLVSVLERLFPKHRVIALSVVYVLVIGFLVAAGFALIPTFAGEAMSLMTRLPSFVSQGSLAHIPLPHVLEPIRAQVLSALTKEAASLQASLVPFIQHAGTQVLSGLEYLVPVVIVPILAFFFLKDAASIRKSLLGAVEDGHERTTVRMILDDVHDVLRNYIRALVLLSVSAFCAWGIFLAILQYPYAVLLAAVCGVLEFIPLVGPITALVIVLVVCLVTSAGGLLWVLIFWACFRIFQDYVLNPFLMSSGIEIHPLLVIFGILAGGRLGGIAGIFFSVPVIAILRVIYGHVRSMYVRRDLVTPEFVPAVIIDDSPPSKREQAQE